MRILVWGINYSPEVTGIGPHSAALCEHLASAGHEVDMVTTFPYYPDWRKAPGDHWTLWRSEQLNGVSVHRCWHFVPRRVSAWKRILHEVSFVWTSLVRILGLRRPDLVFVVSPPLLLGPAAWLVGKLKKAPYVVHVQDLQPDAAVSLGMIRNHLLSRILFTIESFCYRHARAVSGISRGMLAAFARKGVPEGKCFFFPNGVGLATRSERGRFRLRHAIAESDFVALYSGNLGQKQGLEVLIEAARKVQGSRFRLVICGTGAARERLEAIARGVGCVKFLPLQADEEYREMIADCDLAVIPQVAGSGGAFFPSKLLPPFAAAKPVLAIADRESELVRAVEESGGGWITPTNDSESAASMLQFLADRPRELAERGAAGRQWVEQFEQRALLARITVDLEMLGKVGY